MHTCVLENPFLARSSQAQVSRKPFCLLAGILGTENKKVLDAEYKYSIYCLVN